MGHVLYIWDIRSSCYYLSNELFQWIQFQMSQAVHVLQTIEYSMNYQHMVAIPIWIPR